MKIGEVLISKVYRIKQIGSIQQLCRERELETILTLGILLRLLIFFFQTPFNMDPHFPVIQYVVKHHVIPEASQLSQAFQPPLYYIIGAAFLSVGDARTVQAFSVLLSVGTLYVIYRLVNRVEFIRPLRRKKYCLLLACTLPQFVTLSNYISNDPLSYLIGSLIFFQSYKYISEPTARNQNILSVFVGLGLLTKGTLLPTLPGVFLLIIMVKLRHSTAKRRIVASLLTFLFIALSIGSYKYVQNAINYGRPFIHNLDFRPSWANLQKPTYLGLESIYDANLLKVIQHPTVSDSTKHSYPLMMYATFWYKFVPEPCFRGNLTKARYLGSLIYILALLPSLLFLMGFLRIVSSVPNLKSDVLNREEFNKIAYEAFCVFVLSITLLLVVGAGVRYDVWSCFNSRLVFPSFAAIIILFNSGLSFVSGFSKGIQKCVYYTLGVLFLLFITYLFSEIAGIILNKHYGIPDFMLLEGGKRL